MLKETFICLVLICDIFFVRVCVCVCVHAGACVRACVVLPCLCVFACCVDLCWDFWLDARAPNIGIK